MVHAEAYRGLFYGEVPSLPARPVVYQRIEKRITPLMLAMENGISLQRLRQSNPDIRNINGRLPVGFWVAVPGETDNFSGITSPRLAKRKAISVAKAGARDRET
jgi:hypothetical protein